MLEQFSQFFSILWSLVSQPQNLLILFGSSFIGILFGALPGLTATLGVALLATLTYSLDTNAALISLLGLYVGAIYGGSYPAILINIPGTPAAAATAQEGYPMTLQGKGGKALGLTTTASFIGTLFGLFCLVIIAPLIASLALQFTSWEFFLLALFGIVISGTLTSADLVLKGWIAGVIGLTLACVGRDALQFYPRYTFGMSELESGLEIVPVLIAAFGIPQVIRVLSQRRDRRGAERNGSESKWKPQELGPIAPGFASMRKNAKHIVRGAGVGVSVGAVPGVGEDIAAWVSYSAAKNSVSPEEKEQFGKGSEAGLISSECANNACVGGALVPLLTLGIPGSPPAAMLLGALLLHGISPGPTIEVDHPNFLLEVTAILMLASFAMWANGLILARQVVKLLALPSSLFMPIIAVLCVIGAYSLGLNLFNLYVMLPIGVIAYLLTEAKYPISPLVIGLVLGGMADESLRRALMLSDGSFLPLFQRPVALLLFCAIVYTIIIQIPAVKLFFYNCFKAVWGKIKPQKH